MKKLLLFATVLGFVALSHTAIAQDEKEKKEKEKKGSQEIIIRKKGDKDSKIIVEISGDKVTINGKPLAEFKDDEITINNRKVTVWDRNGVKGFELMPDDFGGMNSFSWNGNDEPYAFLGVTTDEDDNGAKVIEVTKESAAEKAGLKKDDIITKLGDKKVDGPESLTDVVRSFKPKEEVTVYYKRDGKENSMKVTLGENKGSGPFAYSFNTPGVTRAFSSPYIVQTPKAKGLNGIPKVQAWGDGESGNVEYFGELFPRHQKLGLKIQDTEDGNGVKVLDVDKDSPAEKAGLKKDDVLTEVGGKKVANTDEAREQLSQNKEKSSYNIKAKRNGNEMSFDIKIPKKLKTANL